MEITGNAPSEHGLELHGITRWRTAYWNLSLATCVEEALDRGEGILTASGAFRALTGKYTGRSPNDKFIVEEPSTSDKIAWGKVNRPISEAAFVRIHDKLARHMAEKDLFVRDCFAGADPDYRLSVRVVTELAWHSAFADRMFIPAPTGTTVSHRPDYTVICVPSCTADRATEGTTSEAFILINFARKLVLIGGTRYAGEIKKSIFSIMNYELPRRGVLSMHCSANIGPDDDTALFFGLSGTGKTTLSADPDRRLIGDDEHGWSRKGIFNIEGGCYAKCINLSAEAEPQIYHAIRFGAIAENVDLNETTRAVDFDSPRHTENTRVAYPLDFIDNALIPSIAPHPKNIVFLTCDAFGVLPPVAKLSAHEAMYHFLSGYTAKVAGTERGITEPQATFSTCFGEPFLPLPPTTFAGMLGELIDRHHVDVWCINTGWSGGGYGVGRRIRIGYTRAMVTAALNGELTRHGFDSDPVFGVGVPRVCPNVPTEILTPRNTWKDQDAYQAKARQLAVLFVDNFKRFKDVSPRVAAAGPTV